MVNLDFIIIYIIKFRPLANKKISKLEWYNNLLVSEFINWVAYSRY